VTPKQITILLLAIMRDSPPAKKPARARFYIINLRIIFFSLCTYTLLRDASQLIYIFLQKQLRCATLI